MIEIVDIEQAFAVDVATGAARRLTKVSERDYGPVSETEFVGTIDLSFKRGDQLVVRDYKSGRNLGNPATKMQLRFFALAYHLLTNESPIRAEFVYVDEDGSVKIEGATLSEIDFLSTMQGLTELAALVATTRTAYLAGVFPNVKPGDHCKYCGAYNHCPAKLSLLKLAIPEVEFVTDTMALMSPEKIGNAYTKLQEIKDLTKRIEEVIRDYVDQQDLPLENGKRLTMSNSSRSSWDANRLIALARKLGADEGSIRTCMKKTTYTRLTQVSNNE